MYVYKSNEKKMKITYFFSLDLNPIEYQNALKHVFNTNRKK